MIDISGAAAGRFNSEFLLSDFATYGSMLLMGLIAGTFLPFVPASSELFLVGLLASRTGQPEALIAAAVVGNVLGGLLNYCAGRYISGLAGKTWFPATAAQLDYVGSKFNRYGVWILLLAWLPVVGDVIAVVAGLLRTEIKLFLVLTTIGKFARYAVIGLGVAWAQS